VLDLFLLINLKYVNPSHPRYLSQEDTLACILALDGFYMEGRNICASYGTSKYCSAFIKNVRCNNPECTYLHQMGNVEDTFMKQEIQAGYVNSDRDVLARQQQIVAQALSASSLAAGGVPPRQEAAFFRQMILYASLLGVFWAVWKQNNSLKSGPSPLARSCHESVEAFPLLVLEENGCRAAAAASVVLRMESTNDRPITLFSISSKPWPDEACPDSCLLERVALF
jgi:hypothetical protein